MGLDESDRCGRKLGLGVGTFERSHLPFRPGRGQTPVPAIAGSADPTNDGVNAISIPFGIG